MIFTEFHVSEKQARHHIAEFIQTNSRNCSFYLKVYFLKKKILFFSESRTLLRFHSDMRLDASLKASARSWSSFLLVFPSSMLVQY